MQFRFRAVIFDMDNTIHDLHGARAAAADAVMTWCGAGDDLYFLSLNRDTPTLIEDSVNTCFGASRKDAVWLYRAVERNSLHIFDGMRELLAELKKAGVKLAVISNADAKDLALRVKELGLEGIFDVLVTPETFGIKKPNPVVYLGTLEALQVAARDAVMIGDRVDRDVEPPRQVGIAGIHAWYGSFDMRDKICAVNDARELIEHLKSE